MTAASLVLTGATPSQAVAPPEQSTTDTDQRATEYDGEALFRGLFLVDGPVADEFPELAEVRAAAGEATPEDRAAQAEINDRIVAGMRAADASFFDTFGDAMTSGNRVLIDRTLQSTQERLTTVLAEEFDIPVEVDDPQAVAVVVVVVVAGALVLVAAAAGAVTVSVSINVNVNTNVNSVQTQTVNLSSIASTDARLDRERWVDRIASQFA